MPVRKPKPQDLIRVHSKPDYRENFALIELKQVPRLRAAHAMAASADASSAISTSRRSHASLEASALSTGFAGFGVRRKLRIAHGPG